MHRENVRTGKPKHQSNSDSRSWLPVAHIFALWAFTVAQPLLDLVGREPDFLVAHRLTGAPLAILALGLALVIPTLLTTPLALPAVRRSRAGSLWQYGLCALLAAAFLLQLLHRLPGAVALVLATAGGGGIAICLRRYRGFSNLVAIAAVAALIAPLVFLLRPGVRGILPTLPETDFKPDAVISEAPTLKSNVPIVLVVFDELPTSSLQRPDGSIDDSRFPSFAALADESHWYPRAVTVGLQTSKAIPAILTGQLPRPNSIAHYRDHSSNLFSWLSAKGGYQMVVHETISQLCPPALCADQKQANPWRGLLAATDDLTVVYWHLLLPPSLRTGLPDVGHAWTGFRGGARSQPQAEELQGRGIYQNVPRVVDGFVSRIGRHRNRGPTLYYLHTNLPHRPWKYLPSGREYTPAGASFLPPGFDNLTYVPEEEQLTIHGLQRHLLQVGYADRVLGQLLDRLKEADVYDRALIVVAADHGISFRPGQRIRLATRANVEDILEVPLFVKRPGQREGAVLEHVVRTVDIVPTIANALNAALPWEVDGTSLNDQSPREITACCYKSPEPPIRSFQTDTARRQQTLDRLHRLFGPDASAPRDGDVPATADHAPSGRDTGPSPERSTDPFEGIFATGPRRDLLGRATGDFQSTNTVGEFQQLPRAHLIAQHSYSNVKPESGFVPSLISGRIEPSVADGTQLAISVDGIVRATAQTFTSRGVCRFSALVPERWLQAGRHQIAVYSVEAIGDTFESSEGTRLRPLTGFEKPPRLVFEGGIVRGLSLPEDLLLRRTETLFRSSVEIVSGGFHGQLDYEPGEGATAVDEFFVFDGLELIYRGEDDRVLRRRSTRRDGRKQVTFRISIPTAITKRSESLRLLARSGDRVQELSFPPTLSAAFQLLRNSDGRVTALLRRTDGDINAKSERIEVVVEQLGLVGFLREHRDQGQPTVRGWAVDLLDPGGVREVVTFLGERQVGVGPPNAKRGDVEARHGRGHLYSGFRYPLSEASSLPSGRSRGPSAAFPGELRQKGVVSYAVSRRGVAARLRFFYLPLEFDEHGVEILPISDGRRLAVRQTGGGLDGAIDLVTKPAKHTLIEGWAGDLERRAAPRQFLVYRDGKFLATLSASRERPDVVEHNGDERLLHTGFRGRVPGAPDPDTFAERHRVFAVMRRGVAVELPVLP